MGGSEEVKRYIIKRRSVHILRHKAWRIRQVFWRKHRFSQISDNMKTKQGIFITATDTHIGKTVVTLALGVLLQKKGFNLGVMKPVQCGGRDALFLKESLKIKDPLRLVNPFFAKDFLSPHIAFKRAKRKIDKKKIIDAYHELQRRHDIVLLEGAGGLMVPITENYLVADLIRDLDLEIIIVSRLGLGTINHTLLTIQQARDFGIPIRGIIFSVSNDKKFGFPERTNPQIIKKLGGIAIIGTIPYLEKIDRKTILKKCASKINLRILLEAPRDSKDSKTQQLGLWDKKYLWHPFTQMKDWLKSEPLIMDEAKDCYLMDTQGRRYLDGVSSLWVNIHGHRRKEIDAAIKRQINKVSHSTFLGLSNTPAIELAKRLVEIAPKGLRKVFYSDNGSTAVEAAIKIAYQYWQNVGKKEKAKIVYFENSYHGDTLGSVSVGGIDLFHKVYRNLTFEAIKTTSPYLKGFENILEKFSSSIAAVIVEPLIQAAAGMLLWPKGMLRRMRELTKSHDIFLIADEVATAFGRTGKMFACEHEGVTPDLMCLAKGMTGGYLPLAATLTTQRVFEGFMFDYKDQKTFFHGHTYTGNPLACAAALANLDIFEKEKTLKRLQPKIKFLDKSLKRFYNLAHVNEVRQLGFMVGIELVKNKKTKEPYAWEEKIGVKVCQEVRKAGLILRPLGNVIVLMPPLAIEIEELKKILEITYRAIERITEKK